AQLDGVVFDDGVGQQFVAHGLDGRPGTVRVGLGNVQLDVLSLTDVFDTLEAQGLQRVRDGPALRVEDTRLEGDVNACLQRTDTPSKIRLGGGPSRRLPRPAATAS